MPADVLPVIWHEVDVCARIITGVATAAISYLLFRLNKTNNERLRDVQELDRDERRLRKELSLDIKMTVEVTTHSKGGLVVAVCIQIRNISRERWCIPTVFLEARSFGDKASSVFVEDQFDELPRCVGDGNHCFDRALPNLAHVRNSIKHLSPDEVENVVCSFRFDRDFVEKNPVIVLRARVFGAGDKELGPDYVIANMRNEWIRYIQSTDAKRLDFCFLERRPISDEAGGCSDELGVEVGKWFLLKRSSKKDGALVADVENTKRFSGVLKTTCRWHQYATVNLRCQIDQEDG